MLNQVCLQNFKTWKQTGPIRLAPITVFFGVNSSGKSSIGQFLLMLRRTVEQSDLNLVFLTSDDRNPVDLGTFADYVHNGDSKLDISFNIQWACPEPVVVEDPLHPKATKLVNSMNFHGVVGTLPGWREQLVCKSFDYTLNPEPDSEDGFVQVRMRDEAVTANGRSNAPPREYDLFCRGYHAVMKRGRPWRLQTPSRFYGFPDQLYAYYQNVGDFANLQLELERMFKTIQYLGPLRQYPRRTYTWSGQAPSDVGFEGENTIAALLAGQHRLIRPAGAKKYVNLQGIVSEWLHRLKVVDSFKVNQVSKSQFYEIKLRMHGRSKEASLLDVGFGVSQLLPVITEAFYAAPNSTVIVEQPELHLHPAVQSELGDLFVEAIRTGERASRRNIQFLIESHSEHLLRRLQRRVAEGKLAPKDVAMYFCEPSPDGTGSTIRPLEVDDTGNIKNWPENFFGDQMTDIAEMRRAGLKRRLREPPHSETEVSQ